MIKKLFFITFLFIGIKIFATEYYVSTNGNNSNEGTSEVKAWKTLAYAVKKVKAGDTVWIKAGYYNNEKVVFPKNGTSSSPIRFIGYKSSPGDIESLYFNYSKRVELDESELPTFKGNDRELNTCLKLYGRSHIIIKNIQITNYRFPIDALSGANNLFFENVIVKNAGGSDVNGIGFRLISNSNHNNTIKNCVSINSSDVAFGVNGNNNKIINCKSYADEDDGNLKGISMDYHLLISGSNNLVKGHYAEHVGKLSHTGHGIVLKGNGFQTENNIIEDCDIININGSIELRHRQVKNNSVKNIRIKASNSVYSGGIHFRDGASYNIVEKVSIEGLKGQNGALSFYDSVEDEGTKFAASNNIIKNVWVANSELGIRLGSSSSKTKEHKINNNVILNCTFYNVGTFIRSYNSATSKENVIQNTIIDSSQKHYYKGIKPEGWLEKNNNYNDNDFAKPSGNKNFSNPTGFIDASNNDFRLKETSSCIDKGIQTNLVSDDYLGVSRPQGNGFDIGAYEYKEVTTSSINAGSDKSICLGQPVELVATGEGSFSWNTGETTKSIVVTPTETTQYSVSNGSSSDSVYVFVNELPVIDLGRDLEIKKGDKITISAPTGFASYNWSTGETTPSITVSPEQQAVYTIVVTNTNGCSSEDSIIINVKEVEEVSTSQNQITVSKNQTICIGDSVVLEANGADSYLWSDGSTENRIEVSPSVTTNYSLLAKKDGEIKTFNIIVYIGSNCSDIDSDKEIVLYPNPTEGKININFKGYELKSEKDELNMYIISLNGNVLFKETVKNKTTAAELKRQFDLSSYSKGVYFFKLQDKDKTETKKIVLK